MECSVKSICFFGKARHVLETSVLRIFFTFMLYSFNYVNCSTTVKQNMCGGVYGVFRKKDKCLVDIFTFIDCTSFI